MSERIDKLRARYYQASGKVVVPKFEVNAYTSWLEQRVCDLELDLEMRSETLNSLRAKNGFPELPSL